MLRTQISLNAAERALLDAEAARTGRSIAALIRDAVLSVYATQCPTAEDLATMRTAFGSWTGRVDDGAAIVEELRSGSRLSE